MIGANERYFEWLKSIVTQYHKGSGSYDKLFNLLFHTRFEALLSLDENRATDGINLRYRFGREAGYDRSFVEQELDIRDCSVLEVMVGLAVRMEESIIGNPDLGDRTDIWFFKMLDSLELTRFTDARWGKATEDRVDNILMHFNRREYTSDGRGSLFHVPSTTRDFRKTEIWYQMHEYLREIK